MWGKIFLYVFIFILFGEYAESYISSQSHSSCDKQRVILTDSWGIITDGPGEYTEESHCQWLIRGLYKLVLFLYLYIF